MKKVPEKEEREVADILARYGLGKAEAAPIHRAFKLKPANWIDFMMRFELGLEKVDPKRAVKSARNIALSYIAGGIVPLSPYFFSAYSEAAFRFSIFATLLALLLFGYVKGRFTGTNPWQSAIRTVVIGGLAAGAAFGIAKII